jgi:hypothetical protein
MNTSSACRLFVYLAREASIGVVLRRGPSDWARLSLWHTDSDAFEDGQWIKGRVYERRSDVSADGSLFAAFVRQSGGRMVAQGGADTWVAVSRPPYFTALAVWFIGGTYFTGGFFPDRTSLWLGFMDSEKPPDIGAVPPWLRTMPARDIPYIERSGEWTERTVHFNRLLRDGWTMLEHEPYRTKWERTHPKEPVTLIMTQNFGEARGQGLRYVVEYWLRSGDQGRESPLGEASWADFDQQGRLVLAREGRLFRHTPSGSFEEIADFNNQSPDPQPAPNAAHHWPPRPERKG